MTHPTGVEGGGRSGRSPVHAPEPALWREYETIGEKFPDAFAQRHIKEVGDIFPVFHDLFQKKAVA